MDIQPSIVGPDLQINPEIILNLFGGAGFPVPGIPVNTSDVWLMFCENGEAVFKLDHCRNLQLKGKTSAHPANVTSKWENGFYQIKGTFGGLVGDIVIAPIEGGYSIRGEAGNYSNFNIRVNFVKSLPKIKGDIRGETVDLEASSLSRDVVAVRGNRGKDRIDVQINYSEEEVIHIHGKSCGQNIDYKVKSLGDKIVMEGITKNSYSKLNFALVDENEFHITGTPDKVPVDYKLTLYENGIAVAGNMGYYQADYALVVFS